MLGSSCGMSRNAAEIAWRWTYALTRKRATPGMA